MRHVEVTHVYIIPVPESEHETLDATVNAGVSIMEQFMKQKARNIKDLRTDWKLLPREYKVQGNGDNDTDEETTVTPAVQMSKQELVSLMDRERDREESKYAIEHDLDQGVSFTGDLMGQRPEAPGHPWDQGLRVLPLDHPLAPAETESLRKEGMLCGELYRGSICIGVRGHTKHGVGHTWVGMTQEEERRQLDAG